jgi:hypothetical protein
VLLRKDITKVRKHAPRVLSGVRFLDAVVKVDLDLADSFRLQSRNHLESAAFVLFGGKEIGVSKRSAVVVADGIAGAPGQLAPALKLDQPIVGYCRLKVIRDQED